MSTEKLPTTVNILDKDYRINCPADEQEALQKAARMLDLRMREIRASGKINGIEHITVMAALYIAHEMVTSGRDEHYSAETHSQIQSMLDRLDSALAENRS